MLKRFLSEGFQVVREHSGTTASATPNATIDDLLSASVGFDLEIIDDAKGLARLRDAAAFPADAEPEEAANKCGLSAAKIEAELRRHRFAIGHNAAIHDLPELEALTGRSFDDLQLVDTIWLSPLAFPGLKSHALNKPYLAQTGLADPVQDTLETIALLRSEALAFETMDREWVEVLRWLCGLGANHKGYEAFFDAVLGRASASSGDDLEEAKPIVDTIVRMFQGQVCMRGLHGQLLHAFETKNGWPLAWVLSWVRHRDQRPAPAEWLLKGELGFREALDELGRRRCSQSGCRRCRDHETSLHSMSRWFPPAEGETPRFQLPLDEKGIAYQQRVMDAALARRSALGILPTGTGKSRCFQVPALEHHERTGDLTVVVSPLKALMEDQAAKAEEEGLPGVARLHSDLDVVTRDEILSDIREGRIALLYLAPESLGSKSTRSVLKSRRIGMWVFDEAHCIPAWGNGFRGDYRRAPKWIAECGGRGSEEAVILCLTATARPETQKAIRLAFQTGMGRSLAVIDGGAERPNLTYRVLPRNDETHEQLSDMLRDPELLPEGGQAIIYAYSRKDTQQIASSLDALGHSVEFYHADRTPEDKARVERDFAEGRLQVIVSTIAFGMGVDCPRVRLVLHTGPSASLEAYAQEAGRAGRDKKPATCILLHDLNEHDRRLDLCAQGHLHKEDIDAVLAYVLDIQRRVQRKTNRFPPISLPYQVVAEDLLGFLKSSTYERAEELQRSRVDRIVDELEAHGLIRKVQAQSGFSHLRVKRQVLDALHRDPHGLSRIQTRIVQHLFSQAARGDEPQLPDELEELADICGLRKTGRLKIVRKAVGALRDRRDLLHFDKTVDIKLGGARIAPRLVSSWAEKSNAVVEVIIALFEARTAAEEETFDDTQEVEEGEQPDKPAPRPFQITLAALLQKVQSELEEGVRLTAKEALQLLEELRRLKLIGVKVTPAQLTRQLTIFAPELEPDDLRPRLEQHRAQTARVFEVLEKLADDERHLRIETDHLAEEVASFDMDVEGTWRAPDGSRLAAGASERLVRRHLRLLTRIKALDISAGLYTKSEAVRVEIARRDTNLTVRSYTQEMFRTGVEAFQEEEIRQLHLMDGYAQRVLDVPDEAPELLKSYFATPSKESLATFFEGEELKVVRENRPAPVQRQIELHSRLDPEQSKIVHDDTSLKDLLVLAGPGAGKTRVLVERIVWLVGVERVPPDQILALCYNRHAAEEIRSRLRAKTALGRRGAVVSVYTYHSFALQVLGQSFGELSDEAVGEEVGLTDTEADSGRKASAFDRILSHASARLNQQRDDGGNLSDLILRRFRWVFVDEFQDVTEDSFALIKEISQQSQKKAASEARSAADLVDVRFIAVGDDDQNIYDFGGASGQHIRAFDRLFNTPKKMPELTWNYRSSGAILRCAAEIISHCSDRLKTREIEIDPDRVHDPLQGRYHRPRDPDLGRVTILENADRTIDSHAALATAELLRLRAAVGKENWRWASTAVLVRRRAHIPVVERALVSAGIEVSRDLQGLVPMARVKEAVRVREWLEKKERVGRVLLPEDIERVAGWLGAHYGSLWARAVAQWLRDYLRDQMDAAEEGPEGSSERSEATEDQPVEISPRLALEEFVEWAHGWRPEQNGVKVLTAHSSKGLEFDNVVVCDCDWLHGLPITGADRRLFYVAATRARYSLSLTTGGLMAPTRRLISVERSEHLAPLKLEPHRPPLASQAKAPLIPCSVRDVFLSFPAWNGPWCYSSESGRQKTKAVIAGLKPGDRIVIKKTQNQSDQNPWHVFAPIENGLHQIGKMQRGFSPGVAGEGFYAEVFALVSWRKTDSDEDQHGKICLDHWFTVIPEWRSIGS
ncbi:RecQ family ATP-dependent DNA helicase [Sulfitobacter sp. TCYB15]|uniref:RecQ family ATP-dependent DNA helicase n=1 Tax=Sulfitobacter sp. TCYB15 TaxID=3229275 RepID=A0AAU8BZD3_9RHOB